jgi:hypothetical protein
VRGLPFGRIANRRDFLYVGNLVHAIAALIDAHALSRRMACARRLMRGSDLDGRPCPATRRALGVAPRVMDVPAALLSLAALGDGSQRASRAARSPRSSRRIAARGAHRIAAVHARPGACRDGRVVAHEARDLHCGAL